MKLYYITTSRPPPAMMHVLGPLRPLGMDLYVTLTDLDTLKFKNNTSQETTLCLTDRNFAVSKSKTTPASLEATLNQHNKAQHC